MPRPRPPKTMKDSLRGRLGICVKGYTCSNPRRVQILVSQNKVPMNAVDIEVWKAYFYERGGDEP